MDRDFHARTFTVAVVSLLFFSGLVCSAYLDLQLCLDSRDGSNDGASSQILSVFDPAFMLFPCHLVDVVVWFYVLCFAVFMGHKWFMYKALGWHYFLLDYCYFHNLTLCALLVWSMVDIEPASKGGFGIPLGFGGGGGGALRPWYRLDVKPIGVAVSLLSPLGRKLYIFLFFGLLSGSVGALLGAIYIWNNALVFHSEDKMTSCYLHLAPATVQTILLHGAMVSLERRRSAADNNGSGGGSEGDDVVSVSAARELMNSCFSYPFLMASHFAMFLVWQLVYHAVNELRSYQRKKKAKRLAAQGVFVETGVLTKRITAYTWMMEKPIGGKSGVGYRFVTCLGMQECRTKFMFSVSQAIIHWVMLTVGYVPMSLTARYWDVWPLLLYIVGFFVFSIRNAAIILKRWIQKLQKDSDQLAQKMKAEEVQNTSHSNNSKNNNDESTSSKSSSSSVSRASSKDK